MQYEPLVQALMKTCQNAGRAILEIYNQDFTIYEKGKDNPVTDADRLAEAIILQSLKETAPDIPVVAEEAASEGHIPDVSDRFFLVDPLDGTKEFINKRDEFTINIALIENREPRFGIVYAPVMKQIYYTLSDTVAHTAELDPEGSDHQPRDVRRLATRLAPKDGYVVVASRSHMNDETKAFLDKYPIISSKSAGSSLKFCLLAAGEADLYPRLGPTMEWDTAAGHAVLRASGGIVVQEDGSPLLYGKADKGFRNPNFVAWGRNPFC